MNASNINPTDPPTIIPMKVTLLNPDTILDFFDDDELSITGDKDVCDGNNDDKDGNNDDTGTNDGICDTVGIDDGTDDGKVDGLNDDDTGTNDGICDTIGIDDGTDDGKVDGLNDDTGTNDGICDTVGIDDGTDDGKNDDVVIGVTEGLIGEMVGLLWGLIDG
jgi:hypothetical protein